MTVANGSHPATPAAGPPDIDCLLFRVGHRLCALPVSAVVETMRPLPVEALAQAPPGVQGIAVIRGEPLPVLALAQWLDGSIEAVDREVVGRETITRFITIRTAERRVALAVNAVVGVEAIAAVSLQQLPPLLGAASARVVTAIGAVDAQLLLLLNAARLVDELGSVNGEPEQPA